MMTLAFQELYLYSLHCPFPPNSLIRLLNINIRLSMGHFLENPHIARTRLQKLLISLKTSKNINKCCLPRGGGAYPKKFGTTITISYRVLDA